VAGTPPSSRPYFFQNPLRPTDSLYETVPRSGCPSAALTAPTSGTLRLSAIGLPSGLTVTTITFVSGSTALAVGSNQWFALFTSARVRLEVTNDDGATAWAASDDKTLTLANPVVTTYDGLYYLGLCVVATTMPTLTGITLASGLSSVVAPILGGNSTAGLTNPASCPATAAAISAGGGFPYAFVS